MSEKSVGKVVMDETDQQLLNEIQAAFPLRARPFAELGTRLGVTEDDALQRYARLKGDRVVRQVSAIFDTRRLGYRSSLVATAVPEERIHAAADLISAHPGVSHNYRRDHEFNIWWTIAVPPDHDLVTHVNALHRLADATTTRILPTRKLYKIGVDLDVSDQRSMDAATRIPTAADDDRPRTAADLDDREVAFLRELQEDIEVRADPFAPMAERLGVAEADILAAAEAFVEEGLMRRFAAVLHHRRAGFGANAMSVWQAPEDRIDEYGYELASYAAVSHCYRRPTYPDWPYALFGMIHATSRERIDEAVTSIRERTGLEDYRLLYSTAEFKKTRVRYFDPAYEAWAQAHLRDDDAAGPVESPDPSLRGPDRVGTEA